MSQLENSSDSTADPICLSMGIKYSGEILEQPHDMTLNTHSPRCGQFKSLSPAVIESAPTWNNRLVIEVPAELGLGLGVHDPLEEDLDPLLHGVALDLGDEPGGAPLLGLDGEGARGRPLGYPVHPGTGEVHQ